MAAKPDLTPLIQHLCNNCDLSHSTASKLIDEVREFFNETVEDFVARRHHELKQELGLSNPQIFQRIDDEIKQMVFASRPLTQRQIRRLIYG